MAIIKNPTAALEADYLVSSASFSGRITTIENAGGAGTPLATSLPTNVDNSGSVVGTSVSASRADHKHFHGYLSGGGFHATATTLSAGFLSPSDKTLYDAVVAATASYALTSTVSTLSSSFDLRINNLTASVALFSATFVNASSAFATVSASYVNTSASFQSRITAVESGASINTGSLVTTASFHAFTASINGFTASFTSSVQSIGDARWVLQSTYGPFTASINSFTQSLNTFSASQNSFSASINTFTASMNAASSSFASNINLLTASVALFSATFINASSAFAAVSASYVNTSASFNLRINNLTASMLSVKSFGAVGDGVTDDTVALQSAIDAVKGGGGGLYVPAGTYMFSHLDMTRINTGFSTMLTMRGEGPAVSVFKQITSATGVAIDISAANWLRFENMGLMCGPNSAVGILATRLNPSGSNCNFNTFVDFWIRGSAASASFVGIGAESLYFDRCWFDTGGACVLYLGATNSISASSTHGTIQGTVSNIDIHAKNCRFGTPISGGVPIRLCDGVGVEFDGCATYNTLEESGSLLAHVVVETPSINESPWPTIFRDHLFEGNGDVFLFKQNPSTNAVYKHFYILNSWCSRDGYRWVTTSGSNVVHSDFIFEGNAGPYAVELQEVEHSRIIHIESGSVITINQNSNACYIRGPSAGTSLNNNLGGNVEFVNAHIDTGKNYDQYGGTLGTGGRYLRYIPATSAPNAGQISTGMIVAASGALWDPAGLGISTPYPAFYDGAQWQPMINYTASFVVASSSFASRITTLEAASSSFNLRINNLTASVALFSATFINASSAFATVSASYVNTSASFQSRITTLEDAGGGGTPLSSLAPTSVNNSGSVVGASLSASRDDHSHFHGYLSGGGFHALVTSLSAGFMSSNDKSLLDAVVVFTASINNLTQSLNSFTASINNFSQSINSFTASFSASSQFIIDSRAVLTSSTSEQRIQSNLVVSGTLKSTGSFVSVNVFNSNTSTNTIHNSLSSTFKPTDGLSNFVGTHVHLNVSGTTSGSATGLVVNVSPTLLKSGTINLFEIGTSPDGTYFTGFTSSLLVDVNGNIKITNGGKLVSTSGSLILSSSTSTTYISGGLALLDYGNFDVRYTTTSSYGSFTASINSFSQSINTFTASMNAASSSFATTINTLVAASSAFASVSASYVNTSASFASRITTLEGTPVSFTAVSSALAAATKEVGFNGNALKNIYGISMSGTILSTDGAGVIDAFSVWRANGSQTIALRDSGDAGGVTMTFQGRTQWSSPANGDVLFRNNEQDNFGLLKLGGTTTSFPALKRSGSALAAFLADDSALTNIFVATAVSGNHAVNKTSFDTFTASYMMASSSFASVSSSYDSLSSSYTIVSSTFGAVSSSFASTSASLASRVTTLEGDTGGGGILDVQHFQAESFDDAGSGWYLTSSAPLLDASGSANGVLVRGFSGTFSSSVGGKFRVPKTALTCAFEWIYQASLPPGATFNKVQWDINMRPLGTTGTPFSYSFSVQTNPDNSSFNIFSQSVGIDVLGLTASMPFQFQLTRVSASVSNQMSHSVNLSEMITVWT